MAINIGDKNEIKIEAGSIVWAPPSVVGRDGSRLTERAAINLAEAVRDLSGVRSYHVE